MRILLYGETGNAGSGAWCYADTLRDMGHEVLTFSDTEGLEPYYGRNYLARGWRKATRAAWPAHRRRHIERLVARVAIERPQIVVILKGLHVGPQDVDALKATGAWVVNINHDDFFSRNRNNWSPLQRAGLPAYDFIFTTREVNVGEIRRINQHVGVFPFAYHPGIHRPVEIPPVERGLWDVDVVFVGTWERERCRLLERLVREVPVRYAIWGAQWENVRRYSPLVPFLRRRPILLNEMAKAIGGAKVALAFLRKENRDTYTQRTFEIPACNGVLLAERTRQHLACYAEDVEAAFFDPESPAELVFKVRALLSNDRWRESLREAGRARLLRDRHTYGDSLERLFREFEAWRNSTSVARPQRQAAPEHGPEPGSCAYTISSSVGPFKQVTGDDPRRTEQAFDQTRRQVDT